MDARTDHCFLFLILFFVKRSLIFFDFILKEERRRPSLFLIFEANKQSLCKCALLFFYEVSFRGI